MESEWEQDPELKFLQIRRWAPLTALGLEFWFEEKLTLWTDCEELGATTDL